MWQVKREQWCNLCYIFTVNILQRRSRKADFHERNQEKIGGKFLLLYWEKHINQCFPTNVNKSIISLICYANSVSVSTMMAAPCKLCSQMKRIRSVPGNRVLPVSSSAIIHPTDQISTEKKRLNTSVMIHSCRMSRKKERFNNIYLSCCNASSLA